MASWFSLGWVFTTIKNVIKLQISQTTGLSFVLSMMTDIRNCGYLRAHTDTMSTDTTHVHTFTTLCTHTTCAHMVRICEHAHVICTHHVHTHSVSRTCTPAPPSPTHLFMIMLPGSTPDRWKWRIRSCWSTGNPLSSGAVWKSRWLL